MKTKKLTNLLVYTIASPDLIRILLFAQNKYFSDNPTENKNREFEATQNLFKVTHAEV